MKGSCRRWLAAAGASLMLTTAPAQQAVAPDLDFLEYLGAWEDSDEEWLAVSQWEDEATPERKRRDRSTDDRETGQPDERPEAKEAAHEAADDELNDAANDEANDEVDDAN